MKIGLFGFMILGIIFYSSCISSQARQMTSEERVEMQVIGSVTAKWNSFHFLHIPPSKQKLENRAVAELKAEAKKQGFSGNIDIRNINIDGGFSFLTFLLPVPAYGAAIMNVQRVIASGDVVEYTTKGGTNTLTQKKLTDAITNASAEMAEKIPVNSTIAILNVYSSDRNTSEYIIGELEYNFVNTGKFKIVDRRRLDQIRAEQNFQLSGEVSDNSAVTIGNMLGANIVITGEITGSGSMQRIILKALDVKTAQIITMARQQL